MAMITKPDDYFEHGCGRCARFDTPDCSTKLWAQALTDLRRIALDAGLSETAKWGHPTYMHAGRNIAILGAFRDHARLTFFNARLIKDPDGVLEKGGPNTDYACLFRFTDAAQVTALEPTIRAYLAEAMGYAEQGITAPKVDRDIPWPDELTEALDADPDLAEAFHALTPGRRKSYLFNLNGAKAPETRFRRIDKFRAKIIAGKGANEY